MKYRLLILLSVSILNANAQNFLEKDTVLNKSKLILVTSGIGLAYSGSLIALSSIWYNQKKTDFHFFNDSKEWNQMDKAGHLFTTYHESKATANLLLWSGVKREKAIIIGGISGFIYQLPIEIFDGFAPNYGASKTDLMANALGSIMFISQNLLFEKEFLNIKFSYHNTSYAKLRPEILGNGFNERLIKDYNGQTYWVSTNLFIINQKIPKWLCLSLGYGADGMIYAQEVQNDANGFESFRQYFVSFDVDLKKIKTNNKVLKTLFHVVDFVKIPMPTIEFNSKNKTKFHVLYF